MKECSKALEQSRRFMSQLSDAGKENYKQKSNITHYQGQIKHLSDKIVQLEAVQKKSQSKSQQKLKNLLCTKLNLSQAEAAIFLDEFNQFDTDDELISAGDDGLNEKILPSSESKNSELKIM